MAEPASKVPERCALCRKPFRPTDNGRIRGISFYITFLEHMRKPAARMHHRQLQPRGDSPDTAHAVCSQCATTQSRPLSSPGEITVRHTWTPSAKAEVALPRSSRLHDLAAIARPDHWVKNVFVLPGALVAWTIDPTITGEHLALRFLAGLGAICLVASSNYVINEILDAPSDRYHPTKRFRPLAAGHIDPASAYVLWLLLMMAGLGLGAVVSLQFGMTLGMLWVMGCVYNIPPLRTKDVAYLDVVSEAVNNPIRMLAGWYIVSSAFPPASLLLSYWMVGCYFMAVKRFAEYREMDDALQATNYRRSFAYYTPDRLLVSIMFYASTAMLFFGAFIMRYKFELIFSFPLIALVMAVYLKLAFNKHSAAQHPEKLYREPLLMGSILACTALIIVLLFVEMPGLQAIFAPTVPPSPFWKPAFAN